jgi:hypothetical protein
MSRPNDDDRHLTAAPDRRVRAGSGDRAQPQTPSEIGWPDEATIAMIGDEPL